MKTTEYQRGYQSLMSEAAKGADLNELLNQARSSITNYGFDKGWKDACMQQLHINQEISQDHIDEALDKFNGYWPNDAQACEDIAKKYNYDDKTFTNAVFQKAKN